MHTTLTLADVGAVFLIATCAAVFVQVRLLPWWQAKAAAQCHTPSLAIQSVSGEIPPEHLAVISAAVAAMFGVHRIVRIDTPDRGHGWTAEARTVHHTSHLPRGSH